MLIKNKSLTKAIPLATLFSLALFNLVKDINPVLKWIMIGLCSILTILCILLLIDKKNQVSRKEYNTKMAMLFISLIIGIAITFIFYFNKEL
jgi:glucan phosphoethanolaminetransferase (alkaline phosphatase superfamily)